MSKFIRDGLSLDRRSVLMGAGAVGGSLLLPRSLRAQEGGTPKRGGTLRVAMPFNPSSLDPITGRSSPEFTSLYALFDGLTELDPVTQEVIPGLAKSFAFENPTTLVLKLEEGVMFHDNTPFNAEAVKFNIERTKNQERSNAKADLTPVTSVEVRGEYEVALILDRPSASLPAILSERAGLMVSPKHVTENGPNVDRLPVGTGPFKLVEWRDNDQVIYERNENYWRDGLPYLDGISFDIITELPTALRSVVAGENDLGLNLDPALLPIIERSSDVVAGVVPTTVLWIVYLNYAKPPLDDIKVRQALNYALDRDEVARVMTYGKAQPTSSLLPIGHWATHKETANYYEYNLEKARDLLSDAGHPDGVSFECFGRSEQVGVKRQEIMLAQWAKAGIKPQMTLMTATQSSAAYFGEKKGHARISPFGGRPDPSQFYSQLYHKDAFFNPSEMELPGYRELFDATEAALDPASRAAAFHKLQDFTVENALTVPIYINMSTSARRSNVNGLVIDAQDRPKLRTVWLS